MATTRRPLRRARKVISETALAVLSDAPLPDDADGFEEMELRDPGSDGARHLWEAHGPRIVERWAAERPGTRPSFWWRFDAPRWKPDERHVGSYYVPFLPEPRKRLGGTGTPAFEVLAYVPSWPFGIPAAWVSGWMPDFYGGDFPGVPIDPADPPLYESQAAYLDRHSLFVPGEKERLGNADYQPERIVP